MRFNITQSGTEIEIAVAQDGAYMDFESVRTEVARRDKTLVIKDVFISENGATYKVPNGLERLLSGLSFEEIADIELLDNASKTLIEKQKTEAEEMLRRSKEALEHAKKTGNWSCVPESVVNDAISQIVLTTSMFVAGRDIVKEIDVITYECAYGMNVFRDLFASVRDIVGGRSKAVEKVLHDACTAAMKGLREEALRMGADGVIAVDLDYSELSGGGKNGMLVAIASGTAVKLGEKSV